MSTMFIAPEKPKSVVLLALEAQSALEFLDTYRGFSQRESGRVCQFMHDAQRRETEPAEAAAYAVLENFHLFITLYRAGETVETTCEQLHLTAFQYDRYIWAWESIQALSQESAAKTVTLGFD